MGLLDGYGRWCRTVSGWSWGWGLGMFRGLFELEVVIVAGVGVVEYRGVVPEYPIGGVCGYLGDGS